jgi:hypothetical protein
MQQALAQGEDGSKLPVLVESQTLQTDVSIVTPGGAAGVDFLPRWLQQSSKTTI